MFSDSRRCLHALATPSLTDGVSASDRQALVPGLAPLTLLDTAGRGTETIAPGGSFRNEFEAQAVGRLVAHLLGYRNGGGGDSSSRANVVSPPLPASSIGVICLCASLGLLVFLGCRFIKRSNIWDSFLFRCMTRGIPGLRYCRIAHPNVSRISPRQRRRAVSAPPSLILQTKRSLRKFAGTWTLLRLPKPLDQETPRARIQAMSRLRERWRARMCALATFRFAWMQWM